MRFIKSFIVPIILIFLIIACGNFPEKIALTNARIIDGTGAPPLERGTLLITEGKIEARGTDISIPGNYKIIDLEGKTVLPGFINSHVHDAYDPETLHRWLKAGITAVRDLGPHQGKDFLALRDKLNGDPKNSRIIAATPLISPSRGYGSFYIDSPDEGEAAARDLIARGADIIKIAIEDNLRNTAYRMLSLE